MRYQRTQYIYAEMVDDVLYAWNEDPAFKKSYLSPESIDMIQIAISEGDIFIQEDGIYFKNDRPARQGKGEILVFNDEGIFVAQGSYLYGFKRMPSFPCSCQRRPCF